jgi:acetyl esterase/lipase
MAQRLRALPESALVVLGTRDRLVRDARLYVASLRAEGAPLDVHEVSGGGHAVNEERPREVASVVMEFLSRPGVGDRQHRAT